MSLDHADDPDARSYEYADRTLLWRMVEYLLAYRKLFAAVVVLTAIGIALTVWTPFILQHAIDDIAAPLSVLEFNNFGVRHVVGADNIQNVRAIGIIDNIGRARVH